LKVRSRLIASSLRPDRWSDEGDFWRALNNSPGTGRPDISGHPADASSTARTVVRVSAFRFSLFKRFAAVRRSGQP